MPTTRRPLVALVLLPLALAACQPGEPAEDTTAAPAPNADEAPAAVLHEVTPADAVPASDVDTKALPGRFQGTLPCASCPGIETVLALRDDGTFAITERYRDEAGTHFDIDGSWSVEGTRVRLDPNAKDEQDRLFQWSPPDELRLLDSEGQPIASEPEQGLVRVPGPG
ncbi:copper resistance protein NlpE [Marilutibacter spongiae]|uniref:Copper resistance protein NlpE N-terminal domain-containing protein n=1 Tax=Marilutibacter spongiae TaxID=2025720 RepID=A0A7W3TMG9_9GAMM|nr:copper resistance protein NlpE [Lysobacter spongiae]MBB1060664.1 copper resistance protein NlpE N-terminal domain-containing protein [Lysobacter spongiae]